MSQDFGMFQGSSSCYDGIPFSISGTITRVQNGIPSFRVSSMPYPQQGPYSAISNVAPQAYPPMPFPQ